MPLALVIGRTGQLARELARAAPPEGWRIALVGREQADLLRPDTLSAAVAAHDPVVVINAAAYTSVDRAEAEPDIAWRANAEAPRTLAAAAREVGAALVQLSTDYVFDGSKAGPWREDDEVHPLSAYGRSKAAGEAGAQEMNPRTVIVRTSWVYAAHGRNFVRTMLALAETRDAIDVVDDQIGRPTSARDLAAVVLAIAARLTAPRAPTGVVHATNAGEPTSWRGVAEAIFETAGARLPRRPSVRAITTVERAAAAPRPANSVLALDRLREQWGIVPRDWRAALAETLDELLDERVESAP